MFTTLISGASGQYYLLIYSPKMYEEQPAIIEWLFSYKKTRLLETQLAISKVSLKKPKYERSPFFRFCPKN